MISNGAFKVVRGDTFFLADMSWVLTIPSLARYSARHELHDEYVQCLGNIGAPSFSTTVVSFLFSKKHATEIGIGAFLRTRSSFYGAFIRKEICLCSAAPQQKFSSCLVVFFLPRRVFCRDAVAPSAQHDTQNMVERRQRDTVQFFNNQIRRSNVNSDSAQLSFHSWFTTATASCRTSWRIRHSGERFTKN